MINALMQVAEDVAERRAERSKRQREEDHDAEEEEQMSEEDESDVEIISGIADLIGRLAKTLKENIIPFLEPALVFADGLLKSSKATDRQSGLCIYDDIIEFLGSKSIPYIGRVVLIAMQAAIDPDPAVRQSAVYGVGLCAQFGGQHVAHLVPEMLSRLSHVITLPDARTPEFICPTENAIAAVGKLCQFQSQFVDLSKVLPVWLSWLPVKEDDIESKVTYGQLCTFIESGSPHLYGEGYQNLPKIFSVFADAFETSLVDEELTMRMVNILKRLQTSLPVDLLQKVWNSLTSEQQQKLQKNMSSASTGSTS